MRLEVEGVRGAGKNVISTFYGNNECQHNSIIFKLTFNSKSSEGGNSNIKN